MRSSKAKAKRKAAARVTGTVFEHIGTSKAWNLNEYRKFKYRASGKVGQPASDVRKVEMTPELQAKYSTQTGETK